MILSYTDTRFNPSKRYRFNLRSEKQFYRGWRNILRHKTLWIAEYRNNGNYARSEGTKKWMVIRRMKTNVLNMTRPHTAVLNKGRKGILTQRKF